MEGSTEDRTPQDLEEELRRAYITIDELKARSVKPTPSSTDRWWFFHFTIIYSELRPPSNPILTKIRAFRNIERKLRKQLKAVKKLDLERAQAKGQITY